MLTERSERIREARKLTRRAGRRKAGLFLAEGSQAVREAVATGPDRTVEVFIAPDALERHPEIADGATSAGIPVRNADDAALAALSETVTPQGLVAVCRSLLVPLDDALSPPDDALRGGTTPGGDVPMSAAPESSASRAGRAVKAVAATADTGAIRLVTVLVNVRDPGNAGTVVRCADAAGSDAVVLTEESVDPEGGKAVRASAGSLFHLPVAAGAPVDVVADRLRAAGLTLLAADGAGELDLDEAAAGLLATPTAWLFGNEAWGLSEQVHRLADHVVRVPIYGRAESLNLASAAAVCLYASARAQRRRSGDRQR